MHVASLLNACVHAVRSSLCMCYVMCACVRCLPACVDGDSGVAKIILTAGSLKEARQALEFVKHDGVGLSVVHLAT